MPVLKINLILKCKFNKEVDPDDVLEANLKTSNLIFFNNATSEIIEIKVFILFGKIHEKFH